MAQKDKGSLFYLRMIHQIMLVLNFGRQRHKEIVIFWLDNEIFIPNRLNKCFWGRITQNARKKLFLLSFKQPCFRHTETACLGNGVLIPHFVKMCRE